MKFSTSTSILLAAALLAPSAVYAQGTTGEASAAEVSDETQPVETAGRRLGTVTVTAQKRETSLQDTAVAISAFTGEMMEDRGIDDVSNLQSYVPNLHVGQEQDGFKISLRGIGLQGTSSISDSGVAFYIDNNYIPRPAGGSAVFYDVERIEVLRGPQGTLYGRNATGGVVNVITKEPNPDGFEGEIGASYGSRNLMELRGVVNIPIAENVAGRISAVYTEEDGYLENLSDEPGTDDFNGTNGDTTLRGQLLFGTPETIEVLVSGTYSELDGTGIAMTYLERNIGGPPPTQALLGTLPPEPADPLETNNNAPASNYTETTMGHVRLRKDFGGFEGILQAGLMDQTTDLFQDFDGSSVDVSRFNKYQTNEAESVEARLSSTGAGPFTWIVGGYYFSEDTYILRVVNLNGLTPGGVINLPDFILDEWGESSTMAAFGTVTYGFTPDFRVSLGARYTEDEKTGRKVTRGNFGAPFPPDIPNAQFPGEASYNKTTWRAGLEWDATEDVFVYATLSNGYKAGGFNITSSGAPYEPETLMAYEFGVKSDLWDNRARVNVDTFYYEYEDMQLTTLTTVNNAPGQLTTNAAQSTIWGIELDTEFLLTDNLSLTASYAYLDATFDEYFNTDTRDPNPVFNPNDPEGLGRTDLSGNMIPYVAENTINIGLRHEADLGTLGHLTSSISHAWHDDKYLREYNDPLIDLVEANGKTDINVTWEVADTNLRLTGYVTNLEDEVEKTNVFVSPGFVGLSATTTYSKPRTIGIRADYSF